MCIKNMTWYKKYGKKEFSLMEKYKKRFFFFAY